MKSILSALSEIEREKIIDFYRSNPSLSKSSERFGIDRMVLYRFLKKKGAIKTLSNRASEHGRRSFNSLSGEERQRLVTRYQEGKSLKEVGIEFNVSWNSVYEYLSSKGLQRKPDERKRIVPLKREDAFSSLTPESVYWIGFLMGDGCVHQPDNPNFSPSISLVGERRDRSHLERFLQFVGSESQVYDTKDINACHIQVYSRRLADDLAKHGIVPRKTYCTEAPSHLINHRDFWRGAVDADGCISFAIRKKRYYYPILQFVGTITLVGQFADFLSRQAIQNTPTVRPDKHSKTYSIAIEASPAVQAITHLYKDAFVSLPRKQALANSIMDGSYKNNVQIEVTPMREHGSSKLTLDQVDEMRRLRITEGWTFKQLLAKFGVNISNAHRICTQSRQSDRLINVLAK